MLSRGCHAADLAPCAFCIAYSLVYSVKCLSCFFVGQCLQASDASQLIRHLITVSDN